MSFHAASAFGEVTSAFLRSAGKACTVPEEIFIGALNVVLCGTAIRLELRVSGHDAKIAVRLLMTHERHQPASYVAVAKLVSVP